MDLGLAFLPAFRRQGYALEASRAMLEYAVAGLRLPRLVAITDPENAASAALLEKLGFGFERRIRLSDAAVELNLFARSLDRPPARA